MTELCSLVIYSITGLRHTDRVIDRYIDGLAASLSSKSAGPLGPFGRVGSILNVGICAAIIAFSVWNGFTDSAFAFAVAGIGIALEVVFVRVAYRARRGDFDSL